MPYLKAVLPAPVPLSDTSILQSLCHDQSSQTVGGGFPPAKSARGHIDPGVVIVLCTVWGRAWVGQVDEALPWQDACLSQALFGTACGGDNAGIKHSDHKEGTLVSVTCPYSRDAASAGQGNKACTTGAADCQKCTQNEG